MFQPVNTVYYVAAIPGLKKKQTINRSFNYDWRYIQLPTDGETPSAGNICIKMKRWCYCALTGARQRHLCWAGYNGGGRGGDSVAGVRRWKSNNEYILHLDSFNFLHSSGRILVWEPATDFPLSCKRRRTWRCWSARTCTNTHTQTHNHIHTQIMVCGVAYLNAALIRMTLPLRVVAFAGIQEQMNK